MVSDAQTSWRRMAAPPARAGTETAEPLRRPSVEHTGVDAVVAADPTINELDEAELVQRIAQLREERDAVILAHNYQRPEIQDLADHLGDSLDLARRAAESDASFIVLCGVRFMAETAAMLCPGRPVLLPEPAADCSLAASVTPAQVRGWKRAHPGGIVVAYVNTTAEVKAECDWCCTSANAVAVVNGLPSHLPILFLPDLALGQHVARSTGRALHLWRGRCHVHAELTSGVLRAALDQHPGSDVLVHPEAVGLTELSTDGSDTEAMRISGTGGMVAHAPAGTPVQVVATESGLVHRLRRENPDKRFVPASDVAVCDYMKTTTLAKLYRSLRDLTDLVTVPADVAARARKPLERMMTVG